MIREITLNVRLDDDSAEHRDSSSSLLELTRMKAVTAISPKTNGSMNHSSPTAVVALSGVDTDISAASLTSASGTVYYKTSHSISGGRATIQFGSTDVSQNPYVLSVTGNGGGVLSVTNISMT